MALTGLGLLLFVELPDLFIDVFEGEGDHSLWGGQFVVGGFDFLGELHCLAGNQDVYKVLVKCSGT